jgi:hypothetical protein
MAGDVNWREWANRNPKVIIATSTIVIAAGLVFLFFPSGRGSRRATRAYYYDLTAKTLFVGKAGELVPIDAPSGKGMGVAATVFGCGDCAESHRFIAYLLRFNADTRARQLADWEQQKLNWAQQGRSGAPELTPMHNLYAGAEVRSIDSDQWVSYNSEAGGQLIKDEIAKHCPGGKVVPCNPGD